MLSRTSQKYLIIKGATGEKDTDKRAEGTTVNNTIENVINDVTRREVMLTQLPDDFLNRN